MIAVLLMTDEPCYAAGFLKLTDIPDDPQVHILGTATSLEEGSALASALRPNVVVVDTMMAGGARKWASLVNEVKPIGVVLALGANFKLSVEQAFAAGARGYLLRSATGPEIVRAIRCLARGDLYIDPRLVSLMLGEQAADGQNDALAVSGMMSRISEREMAVLRRTAYGYSAKEIARDLAISHKSVETYRARATAKLGLDSRSDIIRYANTRGWFASIGEVVEGHGPLRPN